MSDDADPGLQIAGLIRVRVRGGIDTAEQIIRAVRESHDANRIDDASLTAWVDDALAAQAADEATWPAETDPDRLDVAFAALQRDGVLVLPDAGMTQQDALAHAARAYHAAGGEQSGVVGFCFYTRPDLDRACDDGELMLGFGDAYGDPTGAVEVGRRVVAALEADGFTVRWDGTGGERITVTNLDWQRRRG